MQQKEGADQLKLKALVTCAERWKKPRQNEKCFTTPRCTCPSSGIDLLERNCLSSAGHMKRLRAFKRSCFRMED
jgi:hypothetical protein